jgi:putative spermidine/putrescine transport system substrate-binding protein
MKTTWHFHRTRRRFLQKAGVAAALGPLIITDRTIAQTRTLYVNSWGGSYTAAQDAAFFKPFTAATGIQIRTVTPVAYGKIKAQVQSRSYEFDMTSVNSMQWLRASREGLAEPIDWTIVKKNDLPPNAVVADGYGITQNILGHGALLSQRQISQRRSSSWADFWDVKTFPGGRSLCLSDSPRTLIFALLADGVSRDQLYPLDIDRAFKKLDQIKPHVKVWWREGTQSQQLIRDGEVDMMSIWNARASELKQQGVPVEVVWNGAVRSTSTWSVLRGAPNRKLAWELIAFPPRPSRSRVQHSALLRPNPSGRLCLHPKEIALQLPTYADNQAISVREDDQWEAERIVQIEQRFTQWLGRNATLKAETLLGHRKFGSHHDDHSNSTSRKASPGHHDARTYRALRPVCPRLRQ